MNKPVYKAFRCFEILGEIKNPRLLSQAIQGTKTLNLKLMYIEMNFGS